MLREKKSRMILARDAPLCLSSLWITFGYYYNLMVYVSTD